MPYLDLPPKLWVPSKPAIIRPAAIKKPTAKRDNGLIFLPPTIMSRGVVTVSFQTPPSEDTGDTSPYTFTSVPIGTAAGDRIVVVGIASRENAARTISSVTIAGNTATNAVTANDPVAGAGIAALYYLAVPSGTTATIVVTFSGGMRRCYINVWAVYGSSGAPTHTASDTVFSASALNTTISCNANGAILGMAEALASSGTASWTWTNLTEQSDFQSSESAQAGYSGAHSTFSSAQSSLSITATNAGSSLTEGALALAAFGP